MPKQSTSAHHLESVIRNVFAEMERTNTLCVSCGQHRTAHAPTCELANYLNREGVRVRYENTLDDTTQNLHSETD